MAGWLGWPVDQGTYCKVSLNKGIPSLPGVPSPRWEGKRKVPVPRTSNVDSLSNAGYSNESGVRRRKWSKMFKDSLTKSTYSVSLWDKPFRFGLTSGSRWRGKGWGSRVQDRQTRTRSKGLIYPPLPPPKLPRSGLHHTSHFTLHTSRHMSAPNHSNPSPAEATAGSVASPSPSPSPSSDARRDGHGRKARFRTMTFPRKRAVTACDTCRSKKTKCGNERPRCASCAKNGWPCSYDPRLDHSS